MRQTKAFVVVLVLVVVASVACGGGSSPTAPSPVSTSVSPSVSSPILVSVKIYSPETAITVGFSISGKATAVYDDGTEVDVTDVVKWTSSNPDTASVDSSGVVRAVAPGTSLIKGEYRGRVGGMEIVVFPPGATTSISGYAYEVLAKGPVYIVGVVVEVVDPEADRGLRATTGSDGRYLLTGIRSVHFRVRFSHPKYQTREVDWVLLVGRERTNMSAELVRR